MPTINGQGITRGTITLFERENWFGDVSTRAGELIPDGTRVEIVVENVTLSGAIVRGDISGDVPRYQLTGRPEWDKTVSPRAYDMTTVLRSTVFADVAREVLGSSWQSLVVAPPEAKLGGHFERVGTNGNVTIRAKDALTALGLTWYVRNDGITVFGARPSGTVTTNDVIRVSNRNDAIGLRYVNCEDAAAFAPGLTFEGETIGELSYLISPDDVALQVWTRAASNAPLEWLRAGWRRLFPRIELQGLYSYTTFGLASNGKHTLRSSVSRHLPDIGSSDAWTIPGHTFELTPGTKVLVAFADGNPATPVLVAVDPSTLPINSTHEATTLLELDAASIKVGGNTPVVVNSADFIAWVAAVSAGIPVTAPAAYTAGKAKA